MGGLVALLVLCETVKSLLLLPVFRPFLFSAPPPPLDSLLASAALVSLVAAWFVQGVGGRGGTYAARALTVASVRWVGGRGHSDIIWCGKGGSGALVGSVGARWHRLVCLCSTGCWGGGAG